MKFKLIAGKHVVTDGSRNLKYGAGDVIESNENLAEKFKNKFELIHEGGAVEVSRPMAERGQPNAASQASQKEEQKKAERAELKIVQGRDEPLTDEEDAEEEGEDVVALKAVKIGDKQWNVVKVINGEITDEVVNSKPLTSRKQAQAMAKAGIEALDTDEE